MILYGPKNLVPICCWISSPLTIVDTVEASHRHNLQSQSSSLSNVNLHFASSYAELLTNETPATISNSLYPVKNERQIQPLTCQEDKGDE